MESLENVFAFRFYGHDRVTMMHEFHLTLQSYKAFLLYWVYIDYSILRVRRKGSRSRASLTWF